MTPHLLISCKTKAYSAFVNAFTGFVFTFIAAALWEQIGFRWWLCLIMVLSLYLFYKSVKTLVMGGWKIFLLVKNGDLLVTMLTTRAFKKHEAAIAAGQKYDESFALEKIQNLWIKTVTLNHSLVANNIKIRYNGRNIILLSFEDKNTRLDEASLSQVFSFIKAHCPAVDLNVP